MTLVEMKTEISIIKGEKGLITAFTKHDLQARKRMIREADRLIEHYNECILNGDYEEESMSEKMGRR